MNNFRGSKYGTVTGTVWIAKAVRADIKQAIIDGILPKGLKASVRSERFAGGSSIDLRIVEVPEGTVVMNPAYPAHGEGRYSADVEKWLETLRQILLAYNRDNSDSSIDYFDTNFYYAVRVGSNLEEKTP